MLKYRILEPFAERFGGPFYSLWARWVRLDYCKQDADYCTNGKPKDCRFHPY